MLLSNFHFLSTELGVIENLVLARIGEEHPGDGTCEQGESERRTMLLVYLPNLIETSTTDIKHSWAFEGVDHHVLNNSPG